MQTTDIIRMETKKKRKEKMAHKSDVSGGDKRGMGSTKKAREEHECPLLELEEEIKVDKKKKEVHGKVALTPCSRSIEAFIQAENQRYRV